MHTQKEDLSLSFGKEIGLFIYDNQWNLLFHADPTDEDYNIVNAWKENGEIHVTKKAGDEYCREYIFKDGKFVFIKEYNR